MAERILVVEDDPLMLGALEILLMDEGYEVVTAASGMEAIQKTRDQGPFDLVVCDVRMAEMDGIETLSHLKQQQPDTRSIVITGYASPDVPIQAIKLGVDDYLMKPFDDRQFVQSVKRSLESYRLQRRFAQGLEQQWRDFVTIVKTLAEGIEDPDPHFQGHSRRVAELSLKVGRAMGLSRSRLEVLDLAAYLHDIGSLEHKQTVLKRAEELIQEDLARMKEAAEERSEALFSSLASLREVFRVILHHHEWYDGSGQRGLKGDQIPLESRILCAAEAYDAMVSPRPHRESLLPSEARAVLAADAGTQFDPEVVRVMLGLFEAEGAPAEEEEAPEQALSRERQLHLLLGLANTYLAAGDAETAARAYEEGLSLLGETGGSLRSEVLCGLALTCLQRKDLDRAAARAQEALEAAQGGRQLQIGRAHAVRGLVRGVQGSTGPALEDLERARAIFDTWEAHADTARALLYQVKVLKAAGRAAEAAGLMGQAADYIERFGLHEVIRQERSLAIPLLLEAAAGSGDGIARLLGGLGWEAVQPYLADVDTEVRERAIKLLSPREGAAVAAAPPLSLYCFGKLRVFAGGREVDDKHWKTRKSKYMFAYLALHAGKDVPDEKLMDLFWPDVEPEKARQSLYAALSHMRKAMEAVVPGETDRVVLARKGFYRFNADRPFFLDVSEFEKQVEVGNARWREGRQEEAVVAYQKAESLYEGEFLEGYYGDWAVYQRDEYQMRYSEILERLMSYFFAKERFEVSSDYAQRLLKIDNCHQEAHLCLMRAYLAQGKPEQAVRQFQTCKQVMKDELNLAPSPEMSELYLAIKA